MATTINEIKMQMRSLVSKAPFSKELKEMKRKMDLVDFAFSNVRLDGSIITRAGVISILDGNVINNAPVKEHRLIEIHNKLLSKMDDRLEMKMEVDTSVAEAFYKIIIGDEQLDYRTSNPILYHLDFVPDNYTDIRGAFSDALKKISRNDYDGDFCLKAAAFHMEIIRIYPFDDYTEMLARTVMQYELKRVGLFPIAINIDEQLYNHMISEALVTGNPEHFAQIIRKSTIDKLDFLIDKASKQVTTDI